MKIVECQPRIAFERGLKPKPEPHELWAAGVMAECYNTEVKFLRRSIDKTADFKVGDIIWELKSPRGNGKKTIENNLREASRQSQNIVVSLYRTKMKPSQAIRHMRFYLQNEKNRRIKRLVVILKNGKLIDIL